MKKSKFLIVSIVLALFTSCYDDSELRATLQDHESRLAAVEQLCKEMNTNISSLQALVAALQNNDYVTGVSPVVQGSETVGYTISFSKSSPITIYHGTDGKDGADGKDGVNGADGKDGKDGVNGTDGKDGINGADGKDGSTPVIGVALSEDGIYYWTLNGSWLLDADGNKIPAVGKDGKDGQNGKDGTDGTNGTDGKDGQNGADGANGTDGANGKDGITPQLKIEDGYWYISYDNGSSWTQLGKATGEDGNDGANGKDGANGENGKDGDSMFSSIDFTSDANYVIFTLSDGTQIKLPTWTAFEELQRKVNELNTNLSSLQTIVNALQDNDFVTGVAPYMEDGKQIGYTITFSKSGSVVIYNGKDGIDGKDGQDGTNGQDGSTPQVSLGQDTDGNWYWTIDGEWLLDADGNKVRANGIDGADGKDGTDGITPRFDVWGGYWYVSYDDRTSWTRLGKAIGTDGANGTDGKDGQDGKDGVEIFKSFSQDNNNVYLTLSDGTVITIPKAPNQRVQALVFLPEYSDGKAYVEIIEGDKNLEATLQIKPSEYAPKLVEAYNSGAGDVLYADVLPVQQTRAAQIPVTLSLKGLSLLADGVLQATFNASAIDATALQSGSQAHMCCFYAQYEDVVVSTSYVPLGYSVLLREDLSADGTANCYIVNKAENYKFKAVKGNTNVSVGSAASAEVLWESFGTDVAPDVGELVSDVSYKNGYVLFSTPSTLKNGNAVIAVKDASGNILWSWHIWVCKDWDPVATAQVYNNNAGTMMDRNLGATSAAKGDVHALGLLYQWGRKDPFLGGRRISSNYKAASTLSWPSAVESDSSTGKIAYAVANPTTFITRNSYNDDWYYTGNSSTNNTRWNSSKGVYDPCPAGWRVPDGGSTGVWSKAFGTSSSWTTASNWDSTNKGMDFGSTDKKLGSDTIWYPAAGYLGSGGGSLGNVGYYGNYWSCSPDGYYAYCLYFNYRGYVFPSDYYSTRAHGRSVRCLRE